MMKFIKLIGIAAMTMLLAACGSTTNEDHSLFYHGNYSDVVYSYYNESGDFGKQEENLKQIISDAKQKNKFVAPGVYGDLGLVLMKQGKMAEARSAFEQERTLFPESATFIQFLLRKK